MSNKIEANDPEFPFPAWRLQITYSEYGIQVMNLVEKPNRFPTIYISVPETADDPNHEGEVLKAKDIVKIFEKINRYLHGGMLGYTIQYTTRKGVHWSRDDAKEARKETIELFNETVNADTDRDEDGFYVLKPVTLS